MQSLAYVDCVQQNGERCAVIDIDSMGEKLDHTKQPPKVVSLDMILKSMASVLFAILLGICGWLLITIIDHGERLVKAESNIKSNDIRGAEILSLLKSINQQQVEILRNQAQFSIKIEYLEENKKKDTNK